MPHEGYVNTDLPYYPEGTTELWKLFKQTSGLEATELGVRDEEFRALARHAGDVYLPLLFIANDAVVQVALGVVASYIYDRIKNALPNAVPQVHSVIYVKRTKATSVVHVQYDGPADTFEKVVGDALKDALAND